MIGFVRPLRFLPGFLAVTWFWLANNHALAQQFTVEGVQYSAGKLSGTFSGAGPNAIVVKTLTGPINVTISKPKLFELATLFPNQLGSLTLNILIEGTAEMPFVNKDHWVSFSGELGADGRTLSEPLPELTLISAEQGASSTLPIDKSEKGTAPSPASEGIAPFVGQVKSLGKGKLMVAVPTERGRTRQITAAVNEATKIHVRLADPTLASPGDLVQVEGFNLSGPTVPAGQFLATNLTIKLAKPLVSKKRRSTDLPRTTVAKRGKTAGNASADDADKYLPLAEKPPADPAPAKPNKPIAAKPTNETAASQPKDPSPAKLQVEDTFSVDGNYAFDEEEAEK